MSLLIPLTESEANKEKSRQFAKDLAVRDTTITEAKSVYTKSPDQRGLNEALSLCDSLKNKNNAVDCFYKLFPRESKIETCDKIENISLAQRCCYDLVVRSLKLKDYEVKSVCKNLNCYRAYINHNYNYANKTTDRKLLEAREKIREEDKIALANYHPPAETDYTFTKDYNRFHEVIYGGLKSNSTYTLGYDFTLDSISQFGIGLGFYDIKEKVPSADLVFSEVNRNISGRMALGASFPKDGNRKYHLGYGLGVLGFTLYLEARSDFQRAHEFNIGLLYLFQVPRWKTE